MALTFFWRCETETLSGTHDYTAGSDTTATANGSITLDASAARAGSLGILSNASSEQYRFDAETTVWSRLNGTVAMWVQWSTAASAPFAQVGDDSGFTENITLHLVGSGDLRMRIDEDGAGQSNIQTSGGLLAANTFYFVTCSWDQPNNSRRIAVYDTSGALVDSATDTSTAFTAPVALVGGDRFRIGELAGSGPTWKIDNVFVGNAYLDYVTFLANRDITSYTSFSAGSSTTVTPSTGSVVAAGNAPSLNSFTNVRIREVLVNAAGSPVGSRTGVSLLVWYEGYPIGAPDLSYSNMTTDANGTTSWSIATGPLVYGDPIFYVANNGVAASLSEWTCARMIPTYSP